MEIFFLLLIPLFFLLIFGAAIGSLIFWILMLVDVAKRNFDNPNDKPVWILIVALTGVIGAFIYYFVIRKPAKKLGK